MSFMQPFIEKVLAGAIALREMLKALNIAKGYEMPEFGKGGSFDELKDKTDDAAESTENLTKKEEELKRVMLGFDKLNILGENKQEQQTPDYQKLLDEIAKYNSMLDKVKSRATATAESILKWLGYTKDVNTETNEVNWVLSEGETNLQKIIEAVKVLGVVIASIALTKVFNTITTGLTQTISSLKAITSSLNPMVLAITALVAGFVHMYNTNKEFRDTINATMEEIKANLKEIYTQAQPFLEFLGRHIDILIENLTKVGGILGTLLVDVVNLITSLFNVEKLPELFGKIGEDIKNLFLVQFDIVGRAWKNILDSMFGTGTFDKMMTWFSDAWESVKNFFMNIPSWFNNHIVKPIGNFFIVIINGIINGVETAINFIVKGINTMTGALSNLWTWMKIPAIPQIPQVNWGGIPMLANGGVIEQPTMAMVGEYAGAKSNPEIVTPQNIMRQTFMECMLPIAQAIISGDTKVVNAIEELANRPIELNGRKVSESIFSNLQDVAIRKGYTF